MRDFLPSDEDGNSYRGKIATLDAVENVVFVDDPEEEVVLIGVKDLVIVRTGQRTLVIHKDHAESIKRLLQKREDLK